MTSVNTPEYEVVVIGAGFGGINAGVRLRRWRLGGWTDPVMARLGGLPTVSLLSVREGGFPNYHLPSDTPEQVDYGCLEACVDASLAIARAHAA